jgi:disulfide bond formation protein DsbB
MPNNETSSGKFPVKTFPYIVFCISTIALFMSLYFSEIMKLVPCKLCWYQRINMYPILPMTVAGILMKDKKLACYVLPLSIAGLLLALYHNLLVWGIVPESAAPCTAAVACSKQDFVLYGFITIPLMSLAAFAIITILMLIYARSQRK